MHDKAKENNTFLQEVMPKALLFGISLVIVGGASYFALQPKNQTKAAPAVVQDDLSSYQAKALGWMGSLEYPEIKNGVLLLAGLLEKRQEELELIADQMDDLLYVNAEKQLDFCAQESATLLSRYQATNARFTVDIASQIHLLFTEVQKQNNIPLTQSFWQFVSDLGCATYTNDQLKIVKQIVELEHSYKECLQYIAESQSLVELQKHVQEAEVRLAELQKNGYAQTFMQVSLLQSELAPAVEKALKSYFNEPHAIQGTELGSESKSLLQIILSQSGINESHWLSQFDSLMQGKERAKRILYKQGSEFAVVM